MAQDIVSGLFGLSPWQVQQQQQQAANQQAAQFANMNAAQRGVMGMYQAGSGLGGMLAEGMGMVNPAVEEAKNRQAALQGMDISSPEDIMQRAQQIQDPQLKMRLMMMANQMKDAETKRRLDEAHAKYWEGGGRTSGAESLPAKLEIARRNATEIGIKKLNLSGPELDNFVNAEVEKAISLYESTTGKTVPRASTQQFGQDGNITLSDQTSIQPNLKLTEQNKADLIKDAMSRGDVEAARKIASMPITVDVLEAEKSKAAAKAAGTAQGKESVAPEIPQDKIDFYAQQYLQGDTQWQQGLSRTSEGASIIRAVKLRAPELAAEMGMKPQDVMANRQEFQARVKAVKDFSTGKQGDTIRAINTAVDHLDTLSGLGSALKNKDTQAINYIANKAIEWSGGTAPTSFDLAKQIIAEEIVKSIVPGGGGVTERQQLAEKIKSASSPEQLDEGIKTFKKLMAGQLNSLKTQYEQTTKRKDFNDKLTAGAVSALSNIGGTSAPIVSQIPASSQAIPLEDYLKSKGF